MSASGRRGLFAVIASVFMIVSMLPAGTVSAGTVTETAGNTAPADTVPDVSMDGPPVILKAQAMERIENFSASSNQLEVAKERARSRLNDSFAYYQDPTRIDDQHAFIREAEVLRALTDFAGTNQSKRLDQIVELVTRADNQSSRQVIRDAESAFTATEADLGSGMKHSAEAHIDNARRQLARAEQIRERAGEQSGAQSIRTTARAVRTYGQAVNQAHTALGMIDGEVGPEVSLTRQTDPIRNGSERARYTLVGQVSDPTGLDAVNVTATINDDRTVDLPVRGGYANATFAKTINLTARVNTIEISAVESTDNQQSNNGKQKSKQKGKKKGNNGNGGQSSGQSQASTVVLRLDGDGLPDTYEENVTDTDPMDPDSDAPSTEVNEADNGTSGADERVDEQVGVHVVHPEDPGAYLDNSPGTSVKRHSNVHLGELHWDSDPTDPNAEQLDEKTSLEIEVDWLTGHNPSQIRRGGETVLSSTKKNLALYGINVTFDESNSDSIEKSELQDLVKGHERKLLFPGSTIAVPVPIYVTPDSLNVKELSVIENEYHDDDSKLHLLYANEYGSDEPEYLPHDKFIPGNVIGLEGHTGSPGQVAALETTGRVPYGTVVFDNETSSFSEAKKLLMHELGHALSIGWLDDKGDGSCESTFSQCIESFRHIHTIPPTISVSDNVRTA